MLNNFMALISNVKQYIEINMKKQGEMIEKIDSSCPYLQ